MKTHEQIFKTLMHRPAVQAEVERIEREEGELLDAPVEGPPRGGSFPGSNSQLAP